MQGAGSCGWAVREKKGLAGGVRVAVLHPGLQRRDVTSARLPVVARVAQRGLSSVDVSEHGADDGTGCAVAAARGVAVAKLQAAEQRDLCLQEPWRLVARSATVCVQDVNASHGRQRSSPHGLEHGPVVCSQAAAGK